MQLMRNQFQNELCSIPAIRRIIGKTYPRLLIHAYKKSRPHQAAFLTWKGKGLVFGNHPTLQQAVGPIADIGLGTSTINAKVRDKHLCRIC